MDITISLAVLTNIIHITAFVLYNKDILKGHSRPNRTSWGIWAFITILNFTSYSSMSDDWVKSLLPTISSFLCIATFVITLFKNGRFQINKWDAVALSLGIVASLVWFSVKSATYANLILQLALFIGFIPTARSAITNPKNEKPLPWFLWSLAFTLGIFVIVLRWTGQWQDLGYTLNGIICHVTVGCLSLRKRGRN